MFKYNTIISPLDQFEIRNLFSIDTPIFGNANLSITNISLYMTIATFLAFTVSVLATNYSKITHVILMRLEYMNKIKLQKLGIV